MKQMGERERKRKQHRKILWLITKERETPEINDFCFFFTFSVWILREMCTLNHGHDKRRLHNSHVCVGPHNVPAVTMISMANFIIVHICFKFYRAIPLPCTRWFFIFFYYFNRPVHNNYIFILRRYLAKNCSRRVLYNDQMWMQLAV